jgi:hypothetical protein
VPLVQQEELFGAVVREKFLILQMKITFKTLGSPQRMLELGFSGVCIS